MAAKIGFIIGGIISKFVFSEYGGFYMLVMAERMFS
jgi:hypothetical protein